MLCAKIKDNLDKPGNFLYTHFKRRERRFLRVWKGKAPISFIMAFEDKEV